MTEPITDLGTIVNDRDGQEPTVSLDEARLNLRITNQLFDRLAQAAQFHKYPSVEDYCIHKLIESTQTKVGAAYIDTPYSQNGREAKKITGPMGGIISRA